MLIPKKKPFRSKKIRESARGEQCTIRSPLCNFDAETTIWAHSNSLSDGKGMGIKADDRVGAYCCSGCHRWLDEGFAKREVKDSYFKKGRDISRIILKQKGLI